MVQPVEIAEHGVQLLFARDVDARRGLVQHEQLGVADERAREQHALLLTDGKLRYASAPERGHADRLQRLYDLGTLGAPEDGLWRKAAV